MKKTLLAALVLALGATPAHAHSTGQWKVRANCYQPVLSGEMDNGRIIAAAASEFKGWGEAHYTVEVVLEKRHVFPGKDGGVVYAWVPQRRSSAMVTLGRHDSIWSSPAEWGRYRTRARIRVFPGNGTSYTTGSCQSWAVTIYKDGSSSNMDTQGHPWGGSW